MGTVRVTPDKPFAGEEITLSPVPVLTLSGNASWEEAYDKLVATQKQVEAELKRLGLTRTGNVFVVYTTGDDLGFDYEVQVPFSGTTTQKPQGGMKLSGSHAGKALKFTHNGSFADMDNTYEQIANYLDDKNVEQNELYIEQYRTDLATAAPEALVIDILVPVP
ncbi:GyrI-like domain-containing protein [Xanthobacter sp. AM11]|uniref:GyrI-like domain-containing protein n=1 Tax=Xanthobacter sp. AM11 TaxID=3380643 RepID=UPI0039BF9108